MDELHVRGNGVGSAREAEAAPTVFFTPFRLEPSSERLFRAKQGAQHDEQVPHEVVPLKPRAFAILRYLVEHPQRLVTKAELLALWGDVHVSDSVLKTHLRDIRRALGDDVHSPRYIETAHRRGYRFICPTTKLPVAPPPEEAPASVATHAAAPGVPNQAVPSPGARLHGTTQHEGPAERTILERPLPDRAAPLPARGRPGRDPPGVGEPGGGREGYDAPAARAAWAAPAHFVGRTAELQELSAAFERARLEQRGVVLVGGPAGIGKSSLVRAFASRLAPGSCTIAWGQCVAQSGEDAAYLPLIEALSRLGRGPDRAHWVSLVQRVAPSWLPRLPSFRPPASLPQGSAEPAAAAPEYMLFELAEALESATQHEPVLLVLEDVQWADAATAAWLAYVARRTDPARLLVVCTYRPLEVRAASHPLTALKRLLERQAGRSELTLPHLSPAELGEYVEARFPGSVLSDELLALLHARTAGNPAFTIKVVDSWLERGLLEQGAGRWRLAVDPEELRRETPDCVTSLIEQEYEQLTSFENGVIEAASVAGQEFSVASVAAALALDVVSVEGVCVSWARRGQFFQRLGWERWPDGTLATRLGFVHPLYRETAYTRIGAARQACLHLSIAKRQARAYGERCIEIASSLAFHFERGQDHRRAALHLCLAGEKALASDLAADARTYFERGLLLLAHVEPGAERSQVELRLQLGVATALAAIWSQVVDEAQAAPAASLAAASLASTGPGTMGVGGAASLPIITGRQALERAIGKSGAGLTMATPSLAALVGARAGEDARATASLLLDLARSYLGELQRFRSRLDPATACREPGRQNRDHSAPALHASGAAARASLAVLALIGYLDQARPLTSDEPASFTPASRPSSGSSSGVPSTGPDSQSARALGRTLGRQAKPLEVPSAVRLARSWAMGAPAASMARSGSVNTSDWLEHLLEEVDAWLSEGTARPGHADVRGRWTPQGLERSPFQQLQARSLRVGEFVFGLADTPAE